MCRVGLVVGYVDLKRGLGPLVQYLGVEGNVLGRQTQGLNKQGERQGKLQGSARMKQNEEGKKQGRGDSVDALYCPNYLVFIL